MVDAVIRAAGPRAAMTVDTAALEARVLDVLAGLGAAYEVVRIDPAHADTATFCRVYGYAPEASANCLVVAARSGEAQAQQRMAACVVLATQQLQLNRLARELVGARKASFADAEATVARTGMLAGGVTPFGLPDDLPLFVDATVLALDRVIVGGGSRSLKLLIDPEVLDRLPGATVRDDLSRPPRPAPPQVSGESRQV